MLQQVLDLDDRVVGERREFAVERFDDPARVRRAVEEIGIAERDVRRALLHLRADVGEHDVDGDDAELAVVDRHDRAMAAAVLAAARGVGRADDLARAVRHLQRRVAIERGQPRAIRLDELQSSGTIGERRLQPSLEARPWACLRRSQRDLLPPPAPARSTRRAAAAALRSAAHTGRTRRSSPPDSSRARDRSPAAPAASPCASADRRRRGRRRSTASRGSCCRDRSIASTSTPARRSHAAGDARPKGWRPRS